MIPIVSGIGSRMMMMRIGVRSAGGGSEVDRGLGDLGVGLGVGLVGRVAVWVVPVAVLVVPVDGLVARL